ncbi:unnamed protein product [Didymodactylos carnosus]|uniref:Uncharacterized protein n=1 Tax=Didymodactylos carnosus TaxID=1234261 RepID=A0A815HD29_9BILA|nr:unnamed protein product [Didymodactylos carnosus]CAF4220333.1 unnamed protein product [Didymodactylos carnosus]
MIIMLKLYSTTEGRDPVNKIIGDSSLENKFDHNPNDVNEQFRIRTHLEYVENIIRNQSPLSLMKLNALNHLNEYWKRGQFPTHNHFQQQRLPRFIDHNGIHCAAGYMILKSPGFEYLPNKINARYEYSFIDQIANSTDNHLNKWMNMYEFNVNELSMIQPTYEFLNRRQSEKRDMSSKEQSQVKNNSLDEKEKLSQSTKVIQPPTISKPDRRQPEERDISSKEQFQVKNNSLDEEEKSSQSTK